MKNLTKILLPLGFLTLPFFNINNSFSQKLYMPDTGYDDNSLRECVPSEFLNYQNKGYEVVNSCLSHDDYCGYIEYKALNIDKDPEIDVVEARFVNIVFDSLDASSKYKVKVEKYPFAYLFFPGNQGVEYEEWIDNKRDGLNCNEISLDKIFEKDTRKTEKNFKSVYTPRKTVDI